MKWIRVSEREPDSDMAKCLVIAKRNDGSFYLVGYPVFYTTGLKRTLESPLIKGFLNHNVVAWMPWPEHFIKNRSGWTQTAEKYPEKPGQYFISVYNHGGYQKTVIASYDEKHERFYGCGNNEIAWMKIPRCVA